MSNYISADGSLIGDGRNCLFLASEVRCGSTYVAETLAYALNDALGFELWDLGKERFAAIDDDTSPEALLSFLGRLFLDRSGFAASKFLCKSLSYVHRLALASPAVREAFFGPRAFWIVVRRRDRIDQAVSLAAARKSGTFHHYDDPDLAGDRDVELTIEELDAAMKSVAMSDVFLQVFAASLPPGRVAHLYYEDFLRDEAGGIHDICKLCAFPQRDPTAWVNRSKLRPTAQTSKREAKARFGEWFLANYV